MEFSFQRFAAACVTALIFTATTEAAAPTSTEPESLVQLAPTGDFDTKAENSLNLSDEQAISGAGQGAKIAAESRQGVNQRKHVSFPSGLAISKRDKPSEAATPKVFAFEPRMKQSETDGDLLAALIGLESFEGQAKPTSEITPNYNLEDFGNDQYATIVVPGKFDKFTTIYTVPRYAVLHPLKKKPLHASR